MRLTYKESKMEIVIGESHYHNGDIDLIVKIPTNGNLRRALKLIADQNGIRTDRTFSSAIRYLIRKGIEQELKGVTNV